MENASKHLRKALIRVEADLPLEKKGREVEVAKAKEEVVKAKSWEEDHGGI